VRWADPPGTTSLLDPLKVILPMNKHYHYTSQVLGGFAVRSYSVRLCRINETNFGEWLQRAIPVGECSAQSAIVPFER
jgi:hypothetical protein